MITIKVEEGNTSIYFKEKKVKMKQVRDKYLNDLLSAIIEFLNKTGLSNLFPILFKSKSERDLDMFLSKLPSYVKI